MANGVGWLEHFSIDPNDIPKQSGDFGSALYRCLKKGLFSSRDYLNWAKNHYELPTVRENFFDRPVDVALWNEVEDYHPWSKEIVPLFKWEDIFYVACLQPPKEMRANTRFVFLLAPYGLIETLYEKYAKLNPKKKSPTADLPDGFFNNDDTITKTAPNFPAPPDDIDDSPINFEEHQTQVGKKIEEHTFVGAKIGQSTRLGTIALKYFGKLQPMFQNALILEPKGETLVATAWDPSWQPRNPPGDLPVGLIEPSIFRIVARTSHPYHGYVVDNKVNGPFFSNWTGAVPEHVTLVPITTGQRIVGMLLAVGDKEVPQKRSLQLAEAVSKKISEKFSTKKSA